MKKLQTTLAIISALVLFNSTHTIADQPSEKTIGEQTFTILDAKTDVQYLENGETIYNLYQGPRLIFTDTDGKMKTRPEGWNLFHHGSELSKIKESSQPGYEYQLPISEKDIISISSAELQIKEKNFPPQTAKYSQSTENNSNLAKIIEVYPNTDITFTDSGAFRSKKITINQPPTELLANEEIIFWEELQLPENSIVETNGEKVSSEKRTTQDNIKIKTSDGHLTISKSIVFDASVHNTPENLDTSPGVYPVKQILQLDENNNTLKIGLSLPSEYLLDTKRQYPITIDPTYYYCSNNNLDNNGNQIPNCNDNFDDFYLRYLAGGRGFNNELYVGYWNGDGNPNNIATRHIVLKFDLEAIPQDEEIIDARLHIHQDRNTGRGNFEGIINLVGYKISENWNINTIQYQNIRNQLMASTVTTVFSGAENRWRSWNLTGAVQEWHSGQEENYGFLIQPQGDWQQGAASPQWPNKLLIFSSSRNNNNKGPYLTISTQSAAKPDLTTYQTSIENNTLRLGEQTVINLRTRNEGDTISNQSQTGYYLSTNQTFSRVLDRYLGHDNIPQLPPNQWVADSENITIPADWHNLGTNYLLFVADHQSPDTNEESNENNNVSWQQITINPPIQKPDLVPDNGSLEETSLYSGQQTQASITTTNQGGTTDNSNSQVAYYLSEDNSLSNDDRLISVDNVSELEPNEGENDNANFTIPANWHHYNRNYVIFVVDHNNDVQESNENNNQQTLAIDIQPTPDFAEPNDNSDLAVHMNLALSDYQENLTLSNDDEDWFSLTNDNQTYYIKVHSPAGSIGSYILSAQLDQEVLQVNTNGEDNLNTTIELYTSNGTSLSSGNRELQYDFSSLGYCQGLCGNGNVPDTDDLPDRDGDGDSDLVEIVHGSNINNQSSTVFDDNFTTKNSTIHDHNSNNYDLDPVNIRNGSFEFIQTDFSIQGRGPELMFDRTYNSKSAKVNSRLGKGWNHSLNIYYYQDPETKNIQVYLGGALVTQFNTTDQGQTFQAQQGETDSLYWSGDALVYKKLEGTKYLFSRQLTNQLGFLQSITDINNNTMDFQYISRQDIPLLSTVTDASGRTLNIEYGNEEGELWDKIVQISETGDPQLPQNTYYSYDENQNLVSVNTPRAYDGQSQDIIKTFTYDLEGNMITYTDPRGTILTNEYDNQNRVLSQYEHNPRIDLAETNRLIYTAQYEQQSPNYPGSSYCTITQSYLQVDQTVTKTHCFNDQDLKIGQDINGEIIEKWTYNDLGLTSTYTLDGQLVRSYQYDEKNRISIETWPVTENNQYRQKRYSYEDRYNKIISINDSIFEAETDNFISTRNSVFEHHFYESGGIQAIFEVLPGNNTRSIFYDEHGNMNEERIPYSSHNGSRTMKQSMYQYDENNNYLISESGETENNIIGEFQTPTKTYQNDHRGNVTSYTDPRGFTTTYQYDSQDNLRLTTYHDGSTESFEYDLENHLIQETDRLGNITNYIYDTDIEESLISTIQRAMQPSETSITHTYQYDQIGNLTEIIDPNGNIQVITYNDTGQKSSESFAGLQTNYTYNTNGTLQSTSNNAGQQEIYTYDNLQRLKSTSRSLGADFLTESYSYNEYNEKISQTDPNGNTEHFVYDYFGNTKQHTDATGAITNYVYEPYSNIVHSITLPSGDKTTYFIDGLDRVKSQTNANNKSTYNKYDLNGNLIRSDILSDLEIIAVFSNQELIRQGLSPQYVTHSYDGFNNLISTEMPHGYQETYTYDQKNRQTSHTNHRGLTTTIEYDSFDRIIAETINHPNQPQRTEYQYDQNGNLIRERYVAENTEIRFIYDENNKVIEEIDQDNNSTLYSYDLIGNLISTTDRNGQTTTYTYDLLNRRTSETNPQQTTTTYSYDANNNVTSINFDGEETLYTYDARNLITSITHPAYSESYQYDENSNMTTKTNGENEAINYTYDNLQRLVQKDLGEGQSVQYQYDNWSNVLSIQQPHLNTIYQYDALNRQTLENQQFTALPGIEKTVNTTYSQDHLSNTETINTDNQPISHTYNYDGNGRIISVVDLQSNEEILQQVFGNNDEILLKIFGDGTRQRYTYDNLRRIDTITVYRDEAEENRIWQHSYTYDPENNRISMTENFYDQQNNPTHSQQTSYTYDEIEQITSVNYGNPAQDINYSYDPKGNRLTKGDDTIYSYQNGKLQSSITNNLEHTYSYDQKGNLAIIRQKKATDQQNFNTIEQVTTFTFDKENRLKNIITENQVNNPVIEIRQQNTETLNVNYQYDDKGNRVEKDVDGHKTLYLNNGTRVRQTYLPNGQTLKTRIHASQPIAEYESDGTIQYIHTDAIGSTITLTKNQSLSNYEYYPFGENKAKSTNQAETSFLFTNQERDTETNLDYFNGRYYEPSLGRFISRDPFLGIEGDPLTRNLYIYVKNNPYKYTDPSGYVLKALWQKAKNKANYAATKAKKTISDGLNLPGASSYAHEAKLQELKQENSNINEQIIGSAKVAGVAIVQGGKSALSFISGTTKLVSSGAVAAVGKTTFIASGGTSGGGLLALSGTLLAGGIWDINETSIHLSHAVENNINGVFLGKTEVINRYTTEEGIFGGIIAKAPETFQDLNALSNIALLFTPSPSKYKTLAGVKDYKLTIKMNDTINSISMTNKAIQNNMAYKRFLRYAAKNTGTVSGKIGGTALTQYGRYNKDNK